MCAYRFMYNHSQPDCFSLEVGPLVSVAFIYACLTLLL